MGVKDALRAGLTLGTATFGGLTCGLGAAVAGAAGRKDLGDRCAILFSRALLKSAGVRADVFGRDNAAGLGACVILANHRSHLDGPLLNFNSLDRRHPKGGGLARAGLRLAYDVSALEQEGNGFGLDGGSLFKAHPVNRFQDLRRDA